MKQDTEIQFAVMDANTEIQFAVMDAIKTHMQGEALQEAMMWLKERVDTFRALERLN